MLIMNKKTDCYSFPVNRRLRVYLFTVVIALGATCPLQADVFNAGGQKRFFGGPRRDRPMFTNPIRSGFTRPRQDSNYRIEDATSKRISRNINKAQSLIDKGIQAYNRLQWVRAEKYFNKAITFEDVLDNTIATAYRFLGAMAYQTGDVNRARKHFTKSCRLSPSVIPSRTLFAPSLIKFHEDIRNSNNAVSHIEK